MGKHPIHSTLVIFLKFRYPKQSMSCYSLFASTISIQRTNTTAPPPLLLLPLLSHLHQQPPSPSTSELLLTTLAQAMSFITMMGKHPIHNIYLILLKFRYPKQSVSCYSLLCILNIHSAHQYNRSPSITSPNPCYPTLTNSHRLLQQVSCY